ncbi:MAG: YwbE family protein [Ignavibacteriaceae bacterium]|nr:YwbE family protein [Ignavibacteriaceae bacterium]
MNEFKRADVKIGMHVKVIMKEDQRTGKLTEGIIKDILTKSTNHPHGIKVRLETGEVGRVKEILE